MAIRRSDVLVGTAAEWASVNPILGRGQMGVDSTTGGIKIGNGSTRWSALEFEGANIENDGVIDGGTP